MADQMDADKITMFCTRLAVALLCIVSLSLSLSLSLFPPVSIYKNISISLYLSPSLSVSLARRANASSALATDFAATTSHQQQECLQGDVAKDEEGEPCNCLSKHTCLDGLAILDSTGGLTKQRGDHNPEACLQGSHQGCQCQDS